jgi:hypothetical protein
MDTKVRDITPDLARNWLDKTPLSQRKPDPKVVDGYASAMKRGEWRLTHQGIAFDTNGFLIDGQHRLLAIEQAGVIVRIMVTYGLPKEYELAIDGGKLRSLRQHAKYHNKDYTTRDFAIARFIEWGVSYEKFKKHCVTEDQFSLIEKYLPAIRFASQRVVRRGKPLPVVTVAVIARASYSQDHDRLVEFISVLSTGEIKNENDTAAIRLRDYIRENPQYGHVARIELYQRTEAALKAFLKPRPLKSLGKSTVELYTVTQKLLKNFCVDGATA